VKKIRAFGGPMLGGVCGIFKIHGLLVHLPLKETDAAAAFEIDGGNDQHGFKQ
jgi:hypothetical protein